MMTFFEFKTTTRKIIKCVKKPEQFVEANMYSLTNPSRCLRVTSHTLYSRKPSLCGVQNKSTINFELWKARF